jgi:hypothetical protein
VSRGLGWVQRTCLTVIQEYEVSGEWPTTFSIAATVYQIEPDADGNRWISDAQHVAIKRALEGLRRKGHIVGFRTTLSPNMDGNSERCLLWMTNEGHKKWIDEREPPLHIHRWVEDND